MANEHQNAPVVQQVQTTPTSGNGMNAVPAVVAKYKTMRRGIISSIDNDTRLSVFRTKLGNGNRFPTSSEFDEGTNTTWKSKPAILNNVMDHLDILHQGFSGLGTYDFEIIAEIDVLLSKYLNSKQAQTADKSYQKRAAAVELFRTNIQRFSNNYQKNGKTGKELLEEGKKVATDSEEKSKAKLSEKKYKVLRAIEKDNLKREWQLSSWVDGLPNVQDFKDYIYVSMVNKKAAEHTEIINLINKINGRTGDSVVGYKQKIIQLSNQYLATDNAKTNDQTWQRRSAAMELLNERVTASMGTVDATTDIDKLINDDQVNTKRQEIEGETTVDWGEGIMSSVFIEKWKLAVSGFKATIKRNINPNGKSIWMPTGEVFDKGTNTTKISAKPEELNLAVGLLNNLEAKYPDLFRGGGVRMPTDKAAQNTIMGYAKGIEKYLDKHLASDAAQKADDTALQARAVSVRALKNHLHNNFYQKFDAIADDKLDQRIVNLADKEDGEAKEWIDVLKTEDNAKQINTDLNAFRGGLTFQFVPTSGDFHKAANIGMTAESKEKKNILTILKALENTYNVTSTTQLNNLKINNGFNNTDNKDNKTVDFPHIFMLLNQVKGVSEQYLNSPQALENTEDMQKRTKVFAYLNTRMKRSILFMKSDAYVKNLLEDSGIETQDVKRFSEVKEVYAKRRKFLQNLGDIKNATEFKQAVDNKFFPTSSHFNSAIKTSNWNYYGTTADVVPILAKLESDTKYASLFNTSIGSLDASLYADEALFKNVIKIEALLQEYLDSENGLNSDDGAQKRAAVALRFKTFLLLFKKSFNPEVKDKDYDKEAKDKAAAEVRTDLEEKQNVLNARREAVKQNPDTAANLSKVSNVPKGKIISSQSFDNATYIGMTASAGKPKTEILKIIRNIESTTPEIAEKESGSIPVTSLKNHPNYKKQGHLDKGRLGGTLKSVMRQNIMMGRWVKDYVGSEEANKEYGDAYHQRYLAFQALGKHITNFGSVANEAMNDKELGMSNEDKQKARDIGEDDKLSSSNTKLKTRYDNYAANPIIESIYGKLGDLAGDDGSSVTIEAEVKIPITGPFYLAGEMTAEAERGSEDEFESRLELGLKLGAEFGTVDISASIGGYIEAAAKNPGEVASLATYGFYKRCEQTGGFIGGFADVIMGGKESANETMKIIEAQILNENDDAYVELGGYAALGIDVADGTFAGELKGVSGYRYDNTTTDKTKGKSVLGGSVKVGGKFWGAEWEGEYSYLRDQTNKKPLKHELTGGAKLDIPWGNRAVAISDLVVFVKDKAIEYTNLELTNRDSELNQIREEIRTLEAVNGNGDYTGVINDYKEQQKELIESTKRDGSTVEEMAGQLDEASENIKQGTLGKIKDNTLGVVETIEGLNPASMLADTEVVQVIDEGIDHYGKAIIDNENLKAEISNKISFRSDDVEDFEQGDLGDGPDHVLKGWEDNIKERTGLDKIDEAREYIDEKTGIKGVKEELQESKEEKFDISATFDFMEKVFNIEVKTIEAYEFDGKLAKLGVEKSKKVLTIEVGKGGITVEPLTSFFNDGKAVFDKVKDRYH